MTVELLPADMSKEKWLEKCAKHFEQHAVLINVAAIEIAESCFEQFYADYPEDPEGAADEEMSYWGDGHYWGGGHEKKEVEL